MKQLNSFWYLIGDFWSYPTLKVAKFDIIKNFNPEDFREERGRNFIYHDKDGLTISAVEFYSDAAGRWHFLRPRKL